MREGVLKVNLKCIFELQNPVSKDHAPEVHSGERLDHKTDIWNFGVIAYQLYCGGKQPFVNTESLLVGRYSQEELLARAPKFLKLLLN